MGVGIAVGVTVGAAVAVGTGVGVAAAVTEGSPVIVSAVLTDCSSGSLRRRQRQRTTAITAAARTHDPIIMIVFLSGIFPKNLF